MAVSELLSLDNPNALGKLDLRGKKTDATKSPIIGFLAQLSDLTTLKTAIEQLESNAAKTLKKISIHESRVPKEIEGGPREIVFQYLAHSKNHSDSISAAISYVSSSDKIDLKLSDSRKIWQLANLSCKSKVISELAQLALKADSSFSSFQLSQITTLLADLHKSVSHFIISNKLTNENKQQLLTLAAQLLLTNGFLVHKSINQELEAGINSVKNKRLEELKRVNFIKPGSYLTPEQAKLITETSLKEVNFQDLTPEMQKALKLQSRTVEKLFKDSLGLVEQSLLNASKKNRSELESFRAKIEQNSIEIFSSIRSFDSVQSKTNIQNILNRVLQRSGVNPIPIESEIDLKFKIDQCTPKTQSNFLPKRSKAEDPILHLENYIKLDKINSYDRDVLSIALLEIGRDLIRDKKSSSIKVVETLFSQLEVITANPHGEIAIRNKLFQAELLNSQAMWEQGLAKLQQARNIVKTWNDKDLLTKFITEIVPREIFVITSLSSEDTKKASEYFNGLWKDCSEVFKGSPKVFDGLRSSLLLKKFEINQAARDIVNGKDSLSQLGLSTDVRFRKMSRFMLEKQHVSPLQAWGESIIAGYTDLPVMQSLKNLAIGAGSGCLAGLKLGPKGCAVGAVTGSLVAVFMDLYQGYSSSLYDKAAQNNFSPLGTDELKIGSLGLAFDFASSFGGLKELGALRKMASKEAILLILKNEEKDSLVKLASYFFGESGFEKLSAYEAKNLAQHQFNDFYSGLITKMTNFGGVPLAVGSLTMLSMIGKQMYDSWKGISESDESESAKARRLALLTKQAVEMFAGVLLNSAIEHTSGKLVKLDVLKLRQWARNDLPRSLPFPDSIARPITLRIDEMISDLTGSPSVMEPNFVFGMSLGIPFSFGADPGRTNLPHGLDESDVKFAKLIIESGNIGEAEISIQKRIQITAPSVDAKKEAHQLTMQILIGSLVDSKKSDSEIKNLLTKNGLIEDPELNQSLRVLCKRALGVREDLPSSSISAITFNELLDLHLRKNSPKLPNVELLSVLRDPKSLRKTFEEKLIIDHANPTKLIELLSKDLIYSDLEIGESISRVALSSTINRKMLETVLDTEQLTKQRKAIIISSLLGIEDSFSQKILSLDSLPEEIKQTLAKQFPDLDSLTQILNSISDNNSLQPKILSGLSLWTIEAARNDARASQVTSKLPEKYLDAIILLCNHSKNKNYFITSYNPDDGMTSASIAGLELTPEQNTLIKRALGYRTDSQPTISKPRLTSIDIGWIHSLIRMDQNAAILEIQNNASQLAANTNNLLDVIHESRIVFEYLPPAVVSAFCIVAKLSVKIGISEPLQARDYSASKILELARSKNAIQELLNHTPTLVLSDIISSNELRLSPSMLKELSFDSSKGPNVVAYIARNSSNPEVLDQVISADRTVEQAQIITELFSPAIQQFIAEFKTPLAKRLRLLFSFGEILNGASKIEEPDLLQKFTFLLEVTPESTASPAKLVPDLVVRDTIEFGNTRRERILSSDLFIEFVKVISNKSPEKRGFLIELTQQLDQCGRYTFSQAQKNKLNQVLDSKIDFVGVSPEERVNDAAKDNPRNPHMSDWNYDQWWEKISRSPRKWLEDYWNGNPTTPTKPVEKGFSLLCYIAANNPALLLEYFFRTSVGTVNSSAGGYLQICPDIFGVHQLTPIQLEVLSGILRADKKTGVVSDLGSFNVEPAVIANIEKTWTPSGVQRRFAESITPEIILGNVSQFSRSQRAAFESIFGAAYRSENDPLLNRAVILNRLFDILTEHAESQRQSDSLPRTGLSQSENLDTPNLNTKSETFLDSLSATSSNRSYSSIDRINYDLRHKLGNNNFPAQTILDLVIGVPLTSIISWRHSEKLPISQPGRLPIALSTPEFVAVLDSLFQQMGNASASLNTLKKYCEQNSNPFAESVRKQDSVALLLARWNPDKFYEFRNLFKPWRGSRTSVSADELNLIAATYVNQPQSSSSHQHHLDSVKELYERYTNNLATGNQKVLNLEIDSIKNTHLRKIISQFELTSVEDFLKFLIYNDDYSRSAKLLFQSSSDKEGLFKLLRPYEIELMGSAYLKESEKTFSASSLNDTPAFRLERFRALLSNFEAPSDLSSKDRDEIARIEIGEDLTLYDLALAVTSSFGRVGTFYSREVFLKGIKNFGIEGALKLTLTGGPHSSQRLDPRPLVDFAELAKDLKIDFTKIISEAAEDTQLYNSLVDPSAKNDSTSRQLLLEIGQLFHSALIRHSSIKNIWTMMGRKNISGPTLPFPDEVFSSWSTLLDFYNRFGGLLRAP